MTTPKTIDAQTLKNWLESHEAILIDVREPDEFKAEHIPSALSLPLSSLSDHMSKLQFPSGVKIVFQCLSGKRGGNACLLMSETLQSNPDIYNLDGGISSWKSAGHPTIGSSLKSTTISIFRQVQMIVGSLILLCVILGFAATTGFFILAGLFAGMLAIAGLSGWCGLALLLQKAPWNR